MEWISTLPSKEEWYEDALAVKRCESPNLERVMHGLLRQTLRVLGSMPGARRKAP